MVGWLRGQGAATIQVRRSDSCEVGRNTYRPRVPLQLPVPAMLQQAAAHPAVAASWVLLHWLVERCLIVTHTELHHSCGVDGASSARVLSVRALQSTPGRQGLVENQTSLGVLATEGEVQDTDQGGV